MTAPETRNNSPVIDETWVARQLERFVPSDMDAAVAQFRAYRRQARRAATPEQATPRRRVAS